MKKQFLIWLTAKHTKTQNNNDDKYIIRNHTCVKTLDKSFVDKKNTLKCKELELPVFSTQKNDNTTEAKIEFKKIMSITYCCQRMLVSTGKFVNVLRNRISIIVVTNAPCKCPCVFVNVANTHFKI